ncbi:hypothetical protein ECZU34_34220 [Escherichia coli]|nr:hypothetical protein ECZU34_34220 [Escherichia coli]
MYLLPIRRITRRDATVQASVSNINGNTASATHAYSVDATAPTFAINTIATDDILNAAEAGNPLTISGSSTAEAGQTVTVTLNGVTYTGTVGRMAAGASACRRRISAI